MEWTGTLYLYPSSYLSSKSQVVMVNGCFFPPLSITCGVPQGSILGPLLYILFTNDIPHLVHHHPVHYSSPSPHCCKCGSTVSYVDDSTYSYGESDPGILHCVTKILEDGIFQQVSQTPK